MNSDAKHKNIQPLCFRGWSHFSTPVANQKVLTNRLTNRLIKSSVNDMTVPRVSSDDQLTASYFQTVFYITNWAPSRYTITFHLNEFDAFYLPPWIESIPTSGNQSTMLIQTVSWVYNAKNIHLTTRNFWCNLAICIEMIPTSGNQSSC